MLPIITAIHEAGHAVICEFSRYHKFPSGYTYSINSENYSGAIDFGLPQKISNVDQKTLNKEFIQICLAGMVAEQMYCNTSNIQYRYIEQAKPDLQMAKKKMGFWERFFGMVKYINQTKVLVKKHWSEINKLSEFMLENTNGSLKIALDQCDIYNPNKHRYL
jgi:ATP-dependent Zn protease